MHVSFLSIANFLVIVFAKSKKALLDKYEQLGYIHRCQIIKKKTENSAFGITELYIDSVVLTSMILFR